MKPKPMVFRGHALWLYQHLKLNIRMLTPFEEEPAKTLIVEVNQ